MKTLTRHGAFIEEEGMIHLAEMETDGALMFLQSAGYTDRIALDSRAGQKVLTIENCFRAKHATALANPGMLCQRPRLQSA